MTNFDMNLPWTFNVDSLGDNEIVDSAGGVVCNDAQFYPSAPNKEQMEFIIRACNSHEALVAACREVANGYSTRGSEMARVALTAAVAE
jgi:hypothetical protein